MNITFGENMSSKIKLNLDSLKSRREWKRHKVKDGHNVFRVLPPFGESSNGYPYRKWQVIWGLLDPESGRKRPFASSMTSEKRCPVTEYVSKLKVKAENLEAELKASGMSKEDVSTRLKALKDLINELSPKTVYVYNAVDKSGEVGLLELKSTAHKKMKSEMNRYIQDYNQDPTSLNSADDDSGVWFDVTRQGMGRDTEYDVNRCQIKTKTASGKLSFEDDRSPLPEAVVENYDNLAYDLSSVYQIKSYEDLEQILEANMSSLVDMVPDANLDSATVTVTKTVVSTKPSSKVAIRIDDLDDEDEDDVPSTPMNAVRKSSSKATSVALDDDFMAEADAILNG
jgi:hypothetical protein